VTQKPMLRDSFLNYLRLEKRYSPHTLEAYERDLKQFFTYLEKQDVDPDKPDAIQAKFIKNWMVSLMEEGQSTRTLNRKISCLKTYFRFLLKKGAIHKNPMLKIVTPKMKKRLPTFIPAEGMQKLFTELEENEGYRGILEWIILELLYTTGMRRSELVGLKNEDIDLQGDIIRVMGKGGRERLIPISRQLRQTLLYYIKVKESLFKGTVSTAFLLTEKGEPIYVKLVYRIVNKYLTRITTNEQRSPHVLRHTFATHLLNNGAELNAIKELLGHASLAATQVYTHNSIEKLKQVYKQAHPRA